MDENQAGPKKIIKGKDLTLPKIALTSHNPSGQMFNVETKPELSFLAMPTWVLFINGKIKFIRKKKYKIRDMRLVLTVTVCKFIRPRFVDVKRLEA